MATVQHTDPFSRGPRPSQETLRRYVQGVLSPAEQRAVEGHLEQDPFLRDAVEGMQMAGAWNAMDDRRPSFKGASGNWAARLFGLAIIASVIALSVWVLRAPDPSTEQVRVLLGGDARTEAPEQMKRADSIVQVVRAEVASSPTVRTEGVAPVPAKERFVRSAPVVQNAHDTVPVVLPEKRVMVDRATPMAPATVPKEPAKSSRQLVFLHDLKLVHPHELYGSRMPMLYSLGVPADAAGPATNKVDPAAAVTMPYLEFMDAAMGAFAQGRREVALDDLYFLLGQYPDDVNGQFYAALCCYDLGLLPRARSLFDKVKHAPVDTFDEEAAWYFALTVERMDGPSAARIYLDEIADEGGFYAVQARRKRVD